MRQSWDREGLAAAGDLMAKMVAGDVDVHDKYYAEDRKKRRALALARGELVLGVDPLVVESQPQKSAEEIRAAVRELTAPKTGPAQAPGRFPPPPTGANR